MAFSSHLIGLAVLLFVVTVQGQNKYADKAKACYAKGKPDPDTCLKNVYHEIRPDLVKGVPALKIPPYDPMKVDDFQVVEQGAVLQAKASFANVSATGGKDYNIKSIKYDRVNKTMITHLSIPALYVTGHYDVNGTVLLLPLNGKGPFYLNLTSIDATTVGHLVRKGELLTIPKLDVTFKIKDIKLDMDGLLTDDATVGTAVKNMLNENSQQILEGIQTQIENVIGKALRGSFEQLVISMPD